MTHRALASARLRAAAAAIAVAAFAAVPVPATAREAVDPSTLTPVPNPAANPVCGWSGSQVICRSELRFTVMDAETGIFCPGGQLLETTDRHTLTQRFYNSDLLLTKRTTQEWVDGILYVRETGERVRWTGTDTGVQTLTVPGDPGTGTLVNAGAIIHLYLADGRSVTISGRTTENLDTGAYVQVGSNPDGVPICDLIE